MKKKKQKKIEPITDFKNDVLFKYTFRDDKDPDCLYLLKLTIKEIAGINARSITVLNPDLNPQHFDNKDMVLDLRVETDTGEIVNIEMQNSLFSKEQYQRFQIYGANILANQQKRGDDYTESTRPVIQIIFIDDIDKDNLKLIDTYSSQNEDGKKEKYNLITRHYVQMPYINVLKKEKGIEAFNELETAIYIFKNGLDNDIMGLTDKKVIDIMEKKVSTFNEDTLLQEMALNSDLNRRARLAEEKRKLAEGLAKGEEKGRLALAKSVLKTFMKTYPDEDTAFLDNLTLEQYDKISDLLFEDASLDEIKKSIK